MQRDLYYHKDGTRDFSLWKLLACVLGAILFAYISSTISKINLGYGIIVPDWTPDLDITVIVWSALAAISGWSLYLALQRYCPTKAERRVRLLYVSLWVLQAVMAFFWPIGLLVNNRLTFSFVWIAVLDGVVTSLIITAWRLRASSGIVLIPYLAALLLSTYFNLSVIMLN